MDLTRKILAGPGPGQPQKTREDLAWEREGEFIQAQLQLIAEQTEAIRRVATALEAPSTDLKRIADVMSEQMEMGKAAQEKSDEMQGGMPNLIMNILEKVNQKETTAEITATLPRQPQEPARGPGTRIAPPDSIKPVVLDGTG